MELEKILPSRAFRIKAGIIIGLVAVVGVGMSLINNSDDADSDGNPYTFSKIDTDHDGLKDWEEDVWSTDKNNPDTDGDGMTDGDEVLADRDPAKTGDDRLTDSRLASVYGAYRQKTLENTNITEQISDRILPHSLLLANDLDTDSGALLNRNTDRLIDPIVAEYRLENKDFTVEDLNLVDSNLKTLSDYFIDILEIANQTLTTPAGNEVTLALDRNNVNLEKQLNNYRRTVDAMFRANVPNTLGEPHVTVLNNFAQMEQNFKLLASAGSNDSAKSIYALNELKTLQARNLSAIQELAVAWRAESERASQ